jgi:hypothetical protein
VDGDVVDLLQVGLEALAVRAVGVFEHRQLALAVAAHDGEGVLELQVLEVDGGELVDALLGQVLARAGVDQRALDQVVALGVGVEDVVADAHLEQAGHGRLADLVDLRQARDAVHQGLAQGRLLRAGQQGQQGQRQDGQPAARGGGGSWMVFLQEVNRKG